MGFKQESHGNTRQLFLLSTLRAGVPVLNLWRRRFVPEQSADDITARLYALLPLSRSVEIKQNNNKGENGHEGMEKSEERDQPASPPVDSAARQPRYRDQDRGDTVVLVGNFYLLFVG